MLTVLGLFGVQLSFLVLLIGGVVSWIIFH
jgi:hypothetical protein